MFVFYSQLFNSYVRHGLKHKRIVVGYQRTVMFGLRKAMHTFCFKRWGRRHSCQVAFGRMRDHAWAFAGAGVGIDKDSSSSGVRVDDIEVET